MNDPNKDNKFQAKNCDTCGCEFHNHELSSIKLSGFKNIIKVCSSCKSKDPEEHYKTAAWMLSNIKEITDSNSSDEDRLDRIKKLLGE